MNKKFILLLISFIILTSCRESEEVAAIEYGSTKVRILENKTYDDDSNPLIAKDSTATALVEEQDPPVKQGGHWKIKQ